MSKIKDFFTILFNPRLWIYTGGPYSEELDKSINSLLDGGYTFEILNAFEAQLGSYVIWITNYPYASFTTKVEYEFSNSLVFRRTVRPSRVTMLRLKKEFITQYPHLEFLLTE